MGFKFFLPVEVFWGDIKDYVNEFSGYGNKALIVTGTTSKDNGSLKDILHVLATNKIDYCIFNKVIENPPLETVVSAANEGIEANSDFIIAIGGGSAIDTAKAASVFMKYKKTDVRLLFDNDVEDKSMPLLSVPTTAGSGSEMTPSAILTMHTKKTKLSVVRRVRCQKTFINPQYTYNIPSEITVSMALDVLAHLIEGYLSLNANAITDKLVEGGLVEFAKIIPSIKSKNFDPLFRERIMSLSTIAGAVISNTRTTIPHIMSYPVTYDKGVRHGYSCSLFMFEYLKFHKNKEKIAYMLSLCGFSNINGFGNFLKMECPTIKCSIDEIERYASTVCSEKERLKLHPYEIGYEDIVEIYKKSLCNEIDF